MRPSACAEPVVLLRRVDVAGVDAHARRLVRHLALLVEGVLRLVLLARAPVRDHLLLELHRVGAVAVEGVGHRHRALRGRPGCGRGRAVDELLEQLARLRRLALRVEQRGLAQAVAARRGRGLLLALALERALEPALRDRRGGRHAAHERQCGRGERDRVAGRKQLSHDECRAWTRWKITRGCSTGDRVSKGITQPLLGSPARPLVAQ
jgi:hypothetical protein